MTKQRQTETEEQGKKIDCDFKRRKHEEMRHHSQSNREDMTNVIDRATKEAKQCLHRTQDPGNPHRHRATVCIELCIQVYMRLSLKQFMEGPTILVLNHIYNRQMSYKTGVMTCRSTIDGIPLGEKLSTLSTEDFEQIDDNNNDNLNSTTKSFLRAISTTCKAMGHTNKQQKMLDGAVLQCWIFLDSTVYL